MANETQESTLIQDAIRRVSSLLNRKASFATVSARSPQSSKRNSIISLPNKDATPARSALKGGRWPESSTEERRVSFHDSLPCLRFGEPFEYQVSLRRGTIERQNGLLLPAITSGDREVDAGFRDVEGSRKRAMTDPMLFLERVDRRDSSVEPLGLHRTAHVRFPRDGPRAGDPGLTRRNPTCVDSGLTAAEERRHSQSKLRPLPLFAGRRAGDRSSAPSIGSCLKSTISPATLFSNNSSRYQAQVPTTGGVGNASQAFQAHVDQSLSTVRGADERPTSYLHDSLVQMREALDRTRPQDSTRPEARRGSRIETDAERAREARAQALLRLSREEGTDTDMWDREEEHQEDFPLEASTPRSVGTDTSTVNTISVDQGARRRSSSLIRKDDSLPSRSAESGSSGQGQFMVSSPPPLIPVRHPGRRLFVVNDDGLSIASTEVGESEDAVRDSGVVLKPDCSST